MRFRSAFTAAVATMLACAVVGCLSFGDEKSLTYLIGEADYQYHVDKASEPGLYPVLDEECPNESIVTHAPRRIRHPREDELRDLRLAEAIQMAMANNKIIRERAQFLSPQNPLLLGPNQSNNSIYDPAIQETGVQFGNRGLNSALADFDATVTTSLLWGRNESVQNNAFLSGGLRPGDTLTDETGQFSTQVDKQMADGGLFSVSHNWNYSLNNVPSRLFSSAYTGALQFDYRRPLWAGSGTEFTRVVGPVGRNLQNVPTVFQGVVLARINNDISITSFEMNVRNMLKDVEDLYWDLVLAYRTYHSEVVARDSALGTWRKIEVKAGRIKDVGAADEAQARDNYFEARARAENALADLFSTETQLRRMLGLPVNDGTILRPVDEPATAEFLPDWRLSLTEALTRRVELRRQKWQIKALELQKKAAESLTNPRFDLVTSYRINGFGDKLLAKNDSDGATRHGLRSAYGTLTQGDQTGWTLGGEFWIPLGFRQARTQVRNYEIRLVKARAALAAQEHEISHELSIAFQNLDRWYQTAKTNFQRRRAAEARVRSFEALLDREPRVLDLLLRAQISLSQADIAYHRSVAEYNKAITDLHYRKGTLLETDMVSIAEGLWSPEAYDDAVRRAWARSYGIENDQQLRTEPPEFETRDPGSVVIHSLDSTGENGTVPPAPRKATPPKTGKPQPKPPAPKPSQEIDIPFGQKPVDLTGLGKTNSPESRHVPEEPTGFSAIPIVPQKKITPSPVQDVPAIDERFSNRPLKRFPFRRQ